MEIKARVPGTVEALKVKVGDSVKRMDTLFVLEAMKMMQNVPSPTDGEVVEVNIEAGDRVKAGQVVMIIE